MLVLRAISMIMAGRYSPEPVNFAGSTLCSALSMQAQRGCQLTFVEVI